jgi:hypothetical protein
MRLNLHIERLVLEGLPIENHHGPVVKTAIEAELGRLLTTEQLSQHSGGAMPSLRARDINLMAGVTPRALGRQIAQVLYAGIKR